MNDFWIRLGAYATSLHEHSLADLAWFIGAALAAFVARHLWANARIRQRRAALPLVMGGWGTRGKSGTERIKAALINALGHAVVSKTTGCEAMFLHADAYGEMREMFLFRPGDKATIWEQADVMGHAAALRADVFLWECMALTPAYVEVLQRHWVRDDYATLTNAFPDHEDVQGPAGHDIAQVMACFIPHRAAVFTAEEQMRPILAEAARERGSALASVGWLESGLLAPEVLQRFPYDEHPDNIALVLRLGRALGVAEDFALKEMAERVVPDLGVLKTFPEAAVRGRGLQFVNGMSANERFGTLSNWRRTGFDADPQAQPWERWTSTLVNNRADRVARSRVFADLLVRDLRADRHFLIGSNLGGLQGFIDAAWRDHAAGLTLWPAGGGAGPAHVWQRLAGRSRVPADAAQVAQRLAAMLQGAGAEPRAAAALVALAEHPAELQAALQAAGLPQADAVLRHHQAHRLECAAYQALRDRAAQARQPDPQLDHDMRAQLQQWFAARIVVVEDFHASGDRIIELIAEATPPGCVNRVMGLQNIKGTGLDFVYRWQAWEACHRLCLPLTGSDRRAAEAALHGLAGFQEFGIACEEHVRAALAAARSGPLQSPELEELLARAQANLDRQMQQVRASLAAAQATGRPARLLQWLEEVLDAGDAVARRRAADRIYRDLAAQRIGAGRAARELKALNQRQKGGWLAAGVARWRRRLPGGVHVRGPREPVQ